MTRVAQALVALAYVVAFVVALPVAVAIAATRWATGWLLPRPDDGSLEEETT